MLERVERGAYLVRVGNCMACHTQRGGSPFAGGRGVATPFGTVYSSNLTPDEKTGIGTWTAAHFWRAMHHGQAQDGRLLYPAFPYTSYTRVTREDSDAIYAYLRSIPAVVRKREPHHLRFPYSSQWALAGWRALFFQPQSWRADPAQAPEWNRGAYLVQGLGHCAECHSPRNALGGSPGVKSLGGGAMAGHGWYAPALSSASEAGVQDWSLDEIVALLRVGVSERGAVSGPMAEVVHGSTQHLSDTDAQAMARYLQSIPDQLAGLNRRAPAPAAPDALQKGEAIYARHCAECHGDRGEGVRGAFPPLAGNRSVLLHTPANVITVILKGGYLPATVGNPRPHGMPPFLHLLSDDEIAQVGTFVRNAWGNRAPPVATIDVYRARERTGP